MFTADFINLAMDSLFHGREVTAPTAYYIGLSTTAPTSEGGNVTEPSSGGYARIHLDSLSASDAGTVSNSGIIDFGKTTGDWGRITHAVVFDGAEADANVVWHSPLSSAQTVSAGNTLIFNVGELYFNLANKT